MYYVYILASQINGTLYTGVTNDLRRRTWEHKHQLVKGFTKEYGVHILVYYELAENIEEAIKRKEAEKMEKKMEVRVNRKTESRLERSLFKYSVAGSRIKCGMTK